MTTNATLSTHNDSLAPDPLSATFSPALTRLAEAPPSPLPRAVLRVLAGLAALLAAGLYFGHLDVVAVADGKLVPRARVQVVQPADAGVVQAILVREGERVTAGQVLVRLDRRVSEADRARVEGDLAARRLQLRRIDAEFARRPFQAEPGDPPDLAAQALSQWRARTTLHAETLATEAAAVARAEQDLASAVAVERRLRETLATYRVEEQAWSELQRDGFAGRLQAEDKRRKRAEAEQDLAAQSHAIAGLRASLAQARQRLAQTQSRLREQLLAEREQVTADLRRLTGERDKQAVRGDQLELRAPVDGVVKDLATHTTGAVLAPGTALMTLVPAGETLQAEVWVGNEDAGFVREGQAVQVKVVAFPFQKYGMVPGRVAWVGADAADPEPGGRAATRYRTMVELDTQSLETEGVSHRLSPGMQVSAEMRLGERRVIDYLLSPVTQAFREAGRER